MERGVDILESPNTPCKRSTRGTNDIQISPYGAFVVTTATRAFKKELWIVHKRLRSALVMEKDEEITGVVEKVFVKGTLQRLEDILDMDEKSTLLFG